jgi:hypothetical protein
MSEGQVEPGQLEDLGQYDKKRNDFYTDNFIQDKMGKNL